MAQTKTHFPEGSAHCLKQKVTATLVATNGDRFVGFNHTSKDNGGICPRASMATGEGYDLCISVCGQSGHAEEAALKIAGSNAIGSTVYVEGHSYACDNCRAACNKAGVISIVIGSPPPYICSNPYCNEGWVYGVELGDVNLGVGPCQACNEDESRPRP